MKLVNKVKNGKLSISENCDLAILNNFKNCLAYNKAYARIKKIIIVEFENDEFLDFQEIDIQAELHYILENYNQ